MVTSWETWPGFSEDLPSSLAILESVHCLGTSGSLEVLLFFLSEAMLCVTRSFSLSTFRVRSNPALVEAICMLMT